MSNFKKIAVLILGYNSLRYLDDLLQSVLSQKYQTYEVFFIDNNSSDKSIELVSNRYPQIKIIKNKKNLGYALAYKNALLSVFINDFDGAVLLNPDVIVDKDWLAEAVKVLFSKKSIGAVQPKIFLFNNKNSSDGINLINSLGNKINYLGFGFCGDYGEEDWDSPDREVAYASGASLFLKKEAYLSVIDGLDSDFFAYVEDQDLCWRMRMMGYKVFLASNSIVWHDYKYNYENPGKFFLLERNRFYFLFKNYSLKLLFFIMPILILAEFSVIVHSICKGYFFVKFKGYISFLKNIKIILRKRRDIQENRVLKDREMLNLLSAEIDFKDLDNLFFKFFNLLLKFYYKLIIVYFRI